MADATSHNERREGATGLGPRVHELKTHPQYFERVLRGEKPFELRKNDRDYQAGDVLLLREWDPNWNGEAWGSPYTNRELRKVVTYVLCGPRPGLAEGYAILGIADPPRSPSKGAP